MAASKLPYAEWTTEALKDYEEWLYDCEVEGEDVWFERDQVLWELSRRADESGSD